MRKVRDVLRLKLDARLSHEHIACALGISKGVVTKYAGLAAAAGQNGRAAGRLGNGALDGATRSDRLEIIDDRAAHKATIITSQLPIEHWHAWIGGATVADAILDCLMQRHHRITLSGDSLRQSRPKPSKKEKNIDPS